MAYFHVPQPGTEHGPCADADCGHEDCKAQRQIVDHKCVICGEPIGHDRAATYYDGELAHFFCTID